MQQASVNKEIEKWGMYELQLDGPTEGNPYTDVSLKANFIHGEKQVEVEGFYDGKGIYKIRFMPDETGEWEYMTSSNQAVLDKIGGTFNCIQNTKGNLGPVRVHNQYHFAYAEGKEFYPFGTTCYAWIHQPENLQKQTLETLSKSCFNKLRMCVFPKFYSNNSSEPELYPFEGTAPAQWDFTRFCPAFFNRLEKAVEMLMTMGIQVDLILFHPYDKGHWGFDRMDAKTDERYLHYIIARLGAYKNIWWSLANEYDYMEEKTKEDWERNIDIVAKTDPYHHLLSIHQGDVLYDHWNPNITHASIQLGTKKDTVSLGFGVYKAHRDVYHKPVIYDEVGYEGNLIQRWGSLTAQELVDKYWKAIVSGAYMTHGETFTHPEDIIWWSKGGVLKGQCPERIQFLKEILEQSGIDGLEPLDHWWILNGAGKNGQYYLYYFGEECPTEWKFELPAFKIPQEIAYGTQFKVEIIDAWNMTIQTIEQYYEVTDKDRYHYSCNHHPVVELPGKPYTAIRITRV
jgi:hypothetical protein